MIRLRTAKGDIFPVPKDVAAVEICSVDGKLCRVLIPGSDGRISSLDPTDEEFDRYAKAVKADTASLITLDKKFD
jgi:hypothetical protein